MASVATITINSAAGSYSFGDHGAMPLVTRRIEHQRSSGQGFCTRQVSFSLNGYFSGNSHADIVAKYQTLCDMLKCNDATVTYNDGSGVILSNQIMYVDAYNEPTDWKQFSGDYEISMHYFETYTTTSNLGVTASYNGFAFPVVPAWGHSQNPVRQDFNAANVTPGGVGLGSVRHVTLVGRLLSSGNANLNSQIEGLNAACQSDGTLNYGAWSQNVKILSCEISPSFIRDFADYTIQCAYNTSLIYKFDCSMSIQRVHQNPIIKFNLFCDNVSIQTFGNSGQNIDYNYTIQADSVADARTYLQTEVANTIIAGGIEIPGGSETPDFMNNSVSLRFTKFYYPAVWANLLGSDV